VVSEAGEFSYVSARIVNATALDAPALESEVARTYGAIATILAGLRTPFPVRFWNYIPDLHAPMNGALTRYMVFNAGRYRAMSQWLGGRSQVEQRVPTATGVGHRGDDLHVYCLASNTAGRAVENPRQIPAYRYSRRYGPVPPCFSRATAIRSEGRDLLLVGGTASVRGEHSVNGRGIQQQLQETFTNLEALVGAWNTRRDPDGGPGCIPLERFRNLRAYCVNPEYLTVVRSMIEARFAGLETLEVVEARVCRPELLVEIEGVAEGNGA
jgi:chorismate lyase/3-hydroxybenzoate synthase